MRLSYKHAVMVGTLIVALIPFGWIIFLLKYTNNQSTALDTIRSLSIAQHQYRQQCGSFGTLEDLAKARLIRDQLRTGEYSGYKVRISSTGSTFEAVAFPLEYGKTGAISVYVDETGVMREAYGNREARRDDPPVR